MVEDQAGDYELQTHQDQAEDCEFKFIVIIVARRRRLKEADFYLTSICGC
jgi:hypothetical protein